MGVIRNILRFFRPTRRPSGRLLFILGLSLFIASIFFLIQFLNRRSASASSDWYNDGWLYRRVISFGNTGSSESDRKVQVDVDTATLISSGKMQSDCGDVRFTTLQGQVLDYYLDSAGGACNTNSTDFWVRLPTVHAGETAFYIYYGNTAIANGTKANQLLQTTFTPTSGPTVGDEESGPGPVAYWKFDEGQGSTAYDAVGNNTGTLGVGNSQPTWVSEDQCISGKCLFFDGSSDYVEVGTTSIIHSADTSYTVTAWIKIMNNTTAQSLYGQYNAAGDTNHYLRMSNANFGIDEFSPSGGSLNTNRSLNTHQWYFLTAVHNGSNWHLYVNGELDKTGTAETYSGEAPTRTWIGNRFGGLANIYGFNGFIDEVKIYDYARSAAQIKADYAGGAHGSSAVLGRADQSFLSDGLVGYWKMDEAVGSTGSDWTVLDASGNGNNGTGAGDAGLGVGKFGNGGSFDGTGDYVDLPDGFEDFSDGLTFALWAQPTSSGYWARFIELTTGCSSINSILLARSGTSSHLVYQSQGSSAQVTASSFITNDEWQHIVLTHDASGNVRIYRNGVLHTTGSANLPTNATRTRNWFGESACGHGFDAFYKGLMDDVRIYNRALEPDEVKALYQWAPGPVGWWKFDEGSGSSAVDSSGSGNNGTLGAGNSAPTWTQGKFGKALDFDGVDDYVQITNFPGIKTAQTYAFWLNMPDASMDGVIMYTPGWCTGGNGMRIFKAAGTSSMHLTFKDSVDSSIVYVDMPLSSSEWTYITFIKDGTKLFSYKNGILVDTDNMVSTSDTGTNTLRIGHSDASCGQPSFLNGFIDDVKIYNYARTQEQILQDMAGSPHASGERLTSDMAVLHLSFDEGYGTTAYDKSPQGNDGTLGAGNSAPMWANEGKFGKALSFDGVNDYVNLGNDMSFNISGAITVSAWVKPSAFNGGFETIVTKGRAYTNDSTTGAPYYLGTLDGEVIFAIENASGLDNTVSGGDLSLNKWTHVVGAWDGTTNPNNLKIYINGQLAKTSSQTEVATIRTSNDSVVVGYDLARQDSDMAWHGSIDEVKIYPFALTPEQVKQEYAGGQSLVFGSGSTGVGGTSPSNAASREYCVPGDDAYCAAPVGEWKFDKVDGTTTYDTSTNGNHGTLAGGPVQVRGKVGRALKFDGANDYVELGDVLEYSLPVSVSAWVNVRTLDKTFAIFTNDKTTVQHSGVWFEILSNGSVVINYGDNNGTGSSNRRAKTSPAGLITTNQWYHVAANVRGATDMDLYVNGNDVGGSYTGTGETLAYSSRPARIGQLHEGIFASGLIDDVRFYNYSRTSAQIAWEYNRGAPIAWYKFNECQGTTAYNATRNGNNQSVGNHGTIVIGPSGSQTTAGTCKTSGAWYNGRNGKRNGSLSFDGSDDYVNLDTHVNNFNFSGQVTISAWVKTSNDSVGTLYSISDDSESDRYFNLYLGDGVTGTLTSELITIARANDVTGNAIGYTTTSRDELFDGQWHHIAITSDTSSWKIYLDGNLKQLTVGSGSTNDGAYGGINGADTLRIGNRDLSVAPNSLPFNGQIDDVKIFNYALTPEQVKLEYNGGAVRFE